MSWIIKPLWSFLVLFITNIPWAESMSILCLTRQHILNINSFWLWLDSHVHTDYLTSTPTMELPCNFILSFMWSFYPEAAGHLSGTGQYPTTQNLTTQSCQHTITPESDQSVVSEINILNIATHITANFRPTVCSGTASNCNFFIFVRSFSECVSITGYPVAILFTLEPNIRRISICIVFYFLNVFTL